MSNKSGSESRRGRLNRTILASIVLVVVSLGVVGGGYATTTLTSLTTMLQGNTSTSKNPDFTLTPSPLSLSVAQGSQGTYVITLSSLNGFAGSVNITTSLTPAAPNATIAILPNTISLLTGTGSLSISISIPSSVVTGTYLLSITAANRILSHSTVASLTVTSPEDFDLVASASSIAMSAGSSSNVPLTLTSLNGFSGTVTLAAYVSQGQDKGPKPGLSADTVSITTGQSGSAVLLLSTSNGAKSYAYTVTVVATSGSLSHSVSINVTVQG